MDEIPHGKVQTFMDLYAWQESHKLVLMVYKHTKEFPTEERYGLTIQIRRAAVSISSNIAEGFSRRTANDKSHFYSIAHGSLTEVQNQLLIAHDVGYLQGQIFKEIFDQSTRVHKLITGLSKTSPNHPNI